MFLQQVVTMLCLMLVFLIADEIKISSNTLSCPATKHIYPSGESCSELG